MSTLWGKTVELCDIQSGVGATTGLSMVNIILFASSLSSDGNELQLHIPVALVPKEELPISPSVGPKLVRTPSSREKTYALAG